MARMEKSAEINHPVEEVFAFATDIKNWPNWHETIMEAEQTSAGDLGVDTTFRGKASMEGRTAEFTGKITEYDPHKRSRKIMDFGNFTNEDELTFDPIDGGTRFTPAYDVKVRGLAKLLSSRINSVIRKELEQAVSSLKTLLETQS
jgi:uncharacterized protein YndB with AHSA1/START domain